MREIPTQQPLTATDFAAFVWSKVIWVLAAIVAGASGFVLALAISSHSPDSPIGQTAPLDKVTRTYYVVSGFSTTRQALSLAGVSDEAISKLFFPAAADVAQKLLNDERSPINERILKSCELTAHDTTIEIGCWKKVTSTDLSLMAQKAYDSIFAERMEPIEDSLTRVRIQNPSEQLLMVRGLISIPPRLQIKPVPAPVQEELVGNGAVGAISFSFRNALVLGIGGGLLGLFAILLVLLVLVARSGRIHSTRSLHAIVSDQTRVLDLRREGLELIALEISDAAQNVGSRGIAIIPINETKVSQQVENLLGRLSVRADSHVVLGTCEEQIKQVATISQSGVAFVCTLEVTKEVDLRRLIRACELNSKLAVSIVSTKRS